MIPFLPLTEKEKYEHAYHLYRNGQIEKAREVFTDLISKNPLDKTIWFCLAACLQQLKRYQEAIDVWSVVIFLNSKNPSPYYHVAESLFSLKKKNEGLRALEEAQLRCTDQPLIDQINTLQKQWI